MTSFQKYNHYLKESLVNYACGTREAGKVINRSHVWVQKQVAKGLIKPKKDALGNFWYSKTELKAL